MYDDYTPDSCIMLYNLQSASSHQLFHTILIKTMWKCQDGHYYPHFTDEKVEFPSYLIYDWSCQKSEYSYRKLSHIMVSRDNYYIYSE